MSATDVVGKGLDGRPVRVALRDGDRWTLLLFLASICDGCAPFWSLVAGADDIVLAADDVLVVVRNDSTEDPAHLRQLAKAAEGKGVVMSNEAWHDYRVLGPPFAVLVDGTTGTVATETVAWSVKQVAADVQRARARGRRGPT